VTYNARHAVQSNRALHCALETAQLYRASCQGRCQYLRAQRSRFRAPPHQRPAMPSGIIFTAAAALCLACVSAQNLPPSNDGNLTIDSPTWCTEPVLQDTIEVPTCLADDYVTTDVDPDAEPYEQCQSELSIARRQANWAKAVRKCFRHPNKPDLHETNWKCLQKRLAAPFPSGGGNWKRKGNTWIAQTVSGRAAAPLRAIARCARA
jgi:hypothetical protein